MGDARFRDGAERPLRLMAMDAEDLKVVSALAQDAVLDVRDVRWDRRARRLDVLLNRYRWEHASPEAERVRAILTVECVLTVASDGIAQGEGAVLSLLDIGFEPGDAPGGALLLRFSGDGTLRVAVEALEVRLADVTRPYAAPSGMAPQHD